MADQDPLARLEDDPTGDTVHHPYTAFNQGWAASEEGYVRGDNPYPTGSREFAAWDRGWQEEDEDAGFDDPWDDDDEGRDPPVCGCDCGCCIRVDLEGERCSMCREACFGGGWAQ